MQGVLLFSEPSSKNRTKLHNTCIKDLLSEYVPVIFSYAAG